MRYFHLLAKSYPRLYTAAWNGVPAALQYAFLAAVASVVAIASAGFHGTHLHQSIVSPGSHHAHANTHYVKVPVVGHKIVKQPVVTYVPKAVPVLKVGVKPVHTITSIREEPLIV